MKRFWVLLSWLLLAGVTAVHGDDAVTSDAVVKFKIMGTDYPVSNLAMSEDGNWLAVLHQDANRIGIVDVRTGEIKKEFPCRQPSFALWRGGKLIVANRRSGSISVYSTATWELLDRIPVGGNDLFYLTAPEKEHFQSLVLVRSSKANFNSQMGIHLVDLATGKSQLLYDNQIESFAVDHAGKSVVFFQRGSGVCSYEDYLQGKKEKSWIRGNVTGAPCDWFMRQIGDSSLWIYSNIEIYAGCGSTICSIEPLAPTGYSRRSFILPDQNGAYCYAVDDGILNVLSPEAGCAVVASQKFALPGKSQALLNDYPANLTHFSYAVHHNDDLYVFLLKVPVTDLSSPTLYHAVFRGILASANKGGCLPSLPAIAFVGTPVSARIFKETVTDAAIVNAPDGAVVTPEGVLKWTPQQAGIGHFKIRATIGGVVVFKRFSIEVIVKAPAKESN